MSLYHVLETVPYLIRCNLKSPEAMFTIFDTLNFETRSHFLSCLTFTYFSLESVALVKISHFHMLLTCQHTAKIVVYNRVKMRCLSKIVSSIKTECLQIGMVSR